MSSWMESRYYYGCFRWLAQKVKMATAKTQCQALEGQVAAPKTKEQNRLLAEFAVCDDLK